MKFNRPAKAVLACLVWPAAAGCDSPAGTGNRPPADGAAIDGGTSDGAVPDAAMPDGPTPDTTSDNDYSIVVLPDTQYYASSWPDVFMAQTRWVIENRDSERISFVLHTGDLVDSDVPAQWEVASRSMHALDNQVPYVVTAGNHDYANLADRMGMGNIYFPPSQFAHAPWFGGTFEPDHIENSFSLFGVGPARWLVIALEFGPRDEVLDWANTLLKVFRDWPAIVITHAYLYRDGTRYNHAGPVNQQFNPHDYVMMGQAGTTINDGEEIWRKVVQSNSNVKLVFSGHDVNGANLPPGTSALLTSTRTDGSRVHQILANYQTCTNAPCETYGAGTAAQTVRGGNGYLRILRFSNGGSRVAITTYSPYLDSFLSDPGNQFVVELN
jgi:Calcineurin-like phosphoesterase